MVNRDGSTIRWWRKRWDIPTQRTCRHTGGNRRYTIIPDFFSVIDTEDKAYLLGFVAADGCIHRNGRSLDIAVHPRDVEILEYAKTCLGSNAPIYHRTMASFSGEKTRPLYGIYLCSTKLVADLNSLGITPKKSLTLVYPSLPSRLEQHYIRGMWDGDGYIGPRQFCLIGTFSHLQGIQQTIARETHAMLYLAKERTVFRLTGSRMHKAVLHWMYAHSSMHLTRKYNAFLQHWQ